MKNALIILLVVQLFACSAGTEKQTAEENVAVPDSNKEVVCFVYHRFGDSRYPSTNVSLENFEAHLKYLKTSDFQVLTLSDAIDYLKSEKTDKKTAVITIDDGYTSFYKNGLPLLKKYGFPSTLFINTKTIDGSDYMGWKEINEAKKQQVEIGNHTHSHDYFLNLPEAERYSTFEAEIEKSQQLISDNTGSEPEVFAYPYGELDLKMKNIVKSAGFKAAAAQNSGVIYSGTDLMQLPRFPMSESYAALDKFKTKATASAFKIINKTPESSLLPDGSTKPSLQLTLDKSNLRLTQLQCFIQGSQCEVDQTLKDDGTLQLTIAPTSAIDQRRRTLYTLTVPDKEGNWHWFSHLWVNPEVK